MKYTYYGHLTSKEAQVAAKKKYILVLPIGAIEQHGPHLPIDTDDWLALKAAKEGVELAVKKVIHGEEVTNKDALANPEALDCFKDIL